MMAEEMGVPAELLALRDNLEGQIREIDVSIGDLEASRKVVDAQLLGVTRSIGIVSGALGCGLAGSGSRAVLPRAAGVWGGRGREGSADEVEVRVERPASGERAARRNVKALLRGELERRAASGEGSLWVRVRDLTRGLSLQKEQTVRGLEKLGEVIDWDRERDEVRLRVDDRGSLALPASGSLVSADLAPVVEYLRDHDEGVGLNDLLALGYSRGHIMTAVANGSVWTDARGNLRRTIELAPGGGDEEAAE